MARCDRALAAIEDALLLVACLAILAIVVITAADVIARTALNTPFAWSHDLITQYLLVAAFFLSLPYVTRIGGHMSLDFLARRVRRPALRALLGLAGDALALLFVLGFTVGAWNTTVAAYQGGDVLPGDLGLPTWPSHLLGPIGAVVLSLRLVMRIVEWLAAMHQGVIPPHLGVAGQ